MKITLVIFELLISVNLSFINRFAQNSSENTETIYMENDLVNLGNQTRNNNTQISTRLQITGYM